MFDKDKREEIKNYIEVATKIAGLLAVISLSCGFIIWNVYLQRLGFSPDSLFQIRFIFSGIVFLVISLFVTFFLWIILSKPFHLQAISKNFLLALFFLIWLFVVFPLCLFPRIPAYLGGGSARVISLIASEEDIKYLKNFGIPNGLGSLIQTANLCVIYEDANYIVIMMDDRVLSFKKELFEGFGSLPSVETKKQKSDCDKATIFKLRGQDRMKLKP